MNRPFRYDVFVSLLFIVVLLLPLLFSLPNRNVAVSAVEKRKLAEFPDFPRSAAALKSFPKQFEAWYEDHFGFREAIVRAHNYTLLKIFGISPHDMVVAGSDGWYFFNADGAISDYLGRVRYNRKQLERIAWTLQNRSEWLRSLGIRYLYLPVPNKEAVYEEHLPLILRKNKGYDSYSQIVDHLRAGGRFTDFIDTKELLVSKKNEAQLYFRTDSHWNYDGSGLVYRAIVSRLQQWFPDIRPLEEKDGKEWEEGFSGDLAVLMNLGGLVTETAPALNILEECDPGALQPWTRLTELPEYADFPAHRLPVANGCREKRRKAIVIHDSFGLFLRPYLSQHFAAVVYVNTMNFEDARPLIERERPDVVLDLRVARSIDRSVLPDPELEQRLLPEKFAASGPAAIRIDQSNWQDFLYKSRKTAIRETARGLELSFAGPGASVHLQFNNGRQPATPLLVRIQGTSKERQTMSLCSHLRGSRGELQRQVCEERKVQEGANQVFLRLYDPQPEEILELAAGGAGSFTLHSLEVRQESASSQGSGMGTDFSTVQGEEAGR